MNKGILLRDAALKLEEIDVNMALSLMLMASECRPEGLFIKKKIAQYKDVISKEKSQYMLIKEKVASGKLAIIPIGFRCYTKIMLKKKFNITQASLPFDSGFFTPHAVANVIRNGKVELKYGCDQNHSVCTKKEKYRDGNGKSYISFKRSTYSKIDSAVQNLSAGASVNNFLDSTYGYYTLDEENKFILAHYNWHSLSSDEKSKGNRHPSENIPLINDLMNKRIKRMFSLCDSADNILFIYLEDQGYDGMFIDDVKYPLDTFDELREVLVSRFGNKFELKKVNNADLLKDVIVSYT